MKRAFTLIELLVVIAIIAVILSILLPSLAGAKKASRRLKCSNQQGSLAKAIHMYADTYREFWHAVWDNNALRFRGALGNNYLIRPYIIDANGLAQETEAYWAQLYDEFLGAERPDTLFQPGGGIGRLTYIQPWETTRCPESEYTLPAFRNGGALPHDPYTIYSSYCFNGVTPGFDGVPQTATKTFFERRNNRREPRPMHKIEFPSNIIMFNDGSEVMMDGNGDTLVQLDQWTGTLAGTENEQWIREYFRHGDSVVAWTDGHVDTITKGEAQAAREATIRAHGSARSVPLVWYSTPSQR